jgi:hypothetical protein
VGFKLTVSILTVLLAFSTYMTLMTAGLLNPYPTEVVELESVIPYDLSRWELASRYAVILGDEVTARTHEIRLPGCNIEYFATRAGNRVQVGFCRGEFRFVSYTNERGIRLAGFTGDIGSSLNQLLKTLSGDPYLTTDFTYESTMGENGDMVFRGYQTLGGYKILGSGYYIETNTLEGSIKSVMLYDVYRTPLIQPVIPEPKFSQLLTTIRENGYAGFTYRQPIIQGIKVCGDRIAYSLRIVSEQSALHGYEALIDAYTGEVLLLIGLSALGVFRVWEKTCLR